MGVVLSTRGAEPNPSSPAEQLALSVMIAQIAGLPDRSSMVSSPSSIQHLVRQACRLEVLSEKPGNVSPTHQFADTAVDDFLRSADVIAPELARAFQQPLGTTIRKAVEATLEAVGQNTNLGIILLLTPLAAVQHWERVSEELPGILNSTTVQDAEDVYEAIRRAAPGGLGKANRQDITSSPSMKLLDCMRLAADRDDIAAQWATNFDFVFHAGADLLKQSAGFNLKPEQRLGWLALQILAARPDTLIARKCGFEVAQKAQRLAEEAVRKDWPFGKGSDDAYRNLQDYLCAEGHRRNPGTTADLIAAILFCGLRSGWIDSDASHKTPVFTGLGDDETV